MPSFFLEGCRKLCKKIKKFKGHQGAMKDYQLDADRLVSQCSAVEPILAKAERHFSEDLMMALSLLKSSLEDIEGSLEVCKEYCKKHSEGKECQKMLVSQVASERAPSTPKLNVGESASEANLAGSKLESDRPEIGFTRLADDLSFALQILIAAISSVILAKDRRDSDIDVTVHLGEEDEDVGGDQGEDPGEDEEEHGEAADEQTASVDGVMLAELAELVGLAQDATPEAAEKPAKMRVPQRRESQRPSKTLTPDNIIELMQRQMKSRTIYLMPVQTLDREWTRSNNDAKLFVVGIEGQMHLLLVSTAQFRIRRYQDNVTAEALLTKFMEATAISEQLSVAQTITHGSEGGFRRVLWESLMKGAFCCLCCRYCAWKKQANNSMYSSRGDTTGNSQVECEAIVNDKSYTIDANLHREDRFSKPGLFIDKLFINGTQYA